MYPKKKVTFFKCKGGDETALLKVNILQPNGDEVLVSLLNQKSISSIEHKTGIFEMDVGDWGHRWRYVRGQAEGPGRTYSLGIYSLILPFPSEGREEWSRRHLCNYYFGKCRGTTENREGTDLHE